jgi:hypothetical protein
MARWHRSPEALEAARLWRIRCLLKEGSILSGNRLWTLENLLHLDHYFVQNLDEGEGDFLEKLEAQLAPAPAAAKQLAAEVLWILYLSVSERGMKGATKRIQIRRVWEWSGEPLPDAPALGAPLEHGIGFPGTAFNTGRWRELVFCIELFRDWKRLGRVEQHSLISDAWGFAEWVDRRPTSKNRQFRHMLLYLMFPESFERVMTSSHKEQILRRLAPKFRLKIDVEGMDRTTIDRALVVLRGRLEEKFEGADADYYEGPIRAEWQDGGAAPRVPERKTTPSPRSDEERDLLRQLQHPGDRRVWLIAPGEGARLWQEFQRDGICAIGWDELGDLAAYPTYQAAYDALREARGGNPLNDANACFEFAHRMQPGDIVIAKQGRSVILGVGEVTSGYRHDDARYEYRNVRDVRWDQTGRWTVPEEHRMVVKTLTDMTTYPAWLKAAMGTIHPLPTPPDPPGGRRTPPEPRPEPESYTVADALQELFLSLEQFSGILDALGRRKNVILEGAPGVGKTFVARRIAWALMGAKDDSRVQMVQFHQSYAYEDFVQGWRPQAQGFALQDGVFHRFCRRALADPQRNYVFIIDEINRGNLSKIFGELMMLIEADKRSPRYAVPLTYSPEETFYVPQNVYLLGMMNTADRSLAMVDYALRRRFSFIRLPPAFGSEGFANYLIEAGATEDLVRRIVERMDELNHAIAADTRNLGSGYQIGHSFFVPEEGAGELDDAWYVRVVRQEIEPLLREYWFGREEQAREHVERLLS